MTKKKRKENAILNNQLFNNNSAIKKQVLARKRPNIANGINENKSTDISLRQDRLSVDNGMRVSTFEVSSQNNNYQKRDISYNKSKNQNIAEKVLTEIGDIVKSADINLHH